MADEAPPPPGTVVATVLWGSSDGEAGLIVQAADGAADIGLAAVVLCQSICNLPEFPEKARMAAAMLIQQLTGGRSVIRDQPFYVIRGEKGQG
jgi:hypothetical protein